MSPSSRRRQRSTRLTVAGALLVLAAALVAWGVLDNVPGLLAGAAVAAVVLGAAATRITYSELQQSRIDANRDRAAQAKAYLALDTRRAGDHADHVATLQGQIDQREAALRELEEAVVSAQHRAAEATRRRNAEARRADAAETEGAALGRRVDEAEERAAEAIVRLAELEQEADVLRSELTAWQAFAQTGSSDQLRKHA
jgi:chromosome segregation ATPase